MYTVYSKPVRLRWYHWALVIGQGIGAVAVTFIFIWTLSSKYVDGHRLPGVGHQGENPIAIILFIGMFIATCIHLFSKNEVLQYDDNGVRRIRPRIFFGIVNFTGLIEYSKIKEIIRHYDDNIEFTFDGDVGLPMRYGRCNHIEGPPVVEITGNTPQIETFLAIAQAKGVAVTNEHRVEGEKGHSFGVLSVSLVLLAVLIIGSIFLGLYYTGQLNEFSGPPRVAF